MKSSKDILLEFKSEGYVFHGSACPSIKELEPRLATDIDKSNKFNNDMAVFASVKPEASVIFACVASLDIPKNLQVGRWIVDFCEDRNVILAKLPLNWKEFLIKSSGWIYVLDREGFVLESKNNENSVWQVKSHDSVKPVSSVRVEFSDFEDLGAVVEWVS